MKHWKIAVAVLVVLFVLPSTFIYMTFVNSKDCSQIVIDTYEVYSNINIPNCESVNCHYDEAKEIRVAVYDLKGVLDLGNFELIDFSNEEHLQGTDLLNEVERPNVDKAYIAQGVKWNTSWVYIYDDATQRLWAELRY